MSWCDALWISKQPTDQRNSLLQQHLVSFHAASGLVSCSIRSRFMQHFTSDYHRRQLVEEHLMGRYQTIFEPDKHNSSLVLQSWLALAWHTSVVVALSESRRSSISLDLPHTNSIFWQIHNGVPLGVTPLHLASIVLGCDANSRHLSVWLKFVVCCESSSLHRTIQS